MNYRPAAQTLTWDAPRDQFAAQCARLLADSARVAPVPEPFVPPTLWAAMDARCRAWGWA